ncbi:MAG: OmpH family outer membrane protein, partial [Bacteroidales bacterium]|nr:OmpH family outer membrane protein [Bacteroidales bacterium]
QEYQQHAEKELETVQASLFNPMIQKAKDAIAEVAKEQKYTYIFDTANSGILLYYGESDNILEPVKKKLNLK